MAEKLFSLSELCRITGRSRVTLRMWCNSGKISPKIENERIFVPMSEVFRVFPGITAADIEAKAAPTKEATLESIQPEAPADAESRLKAELERLRATIADQELLITDQRRTIETLQFKLELLTNQVESLSTDKAFLIRQVETKDDQLSLVGRLITERSSSPVAEQPARPKNPAAAEKAARQPRDEHGHFVKERPAGAGTAALLPDSEN